MAAAVADFTPARGPAAGKIEKDASGAPISLALERTPDILAELGARRGGSSRPVLIGFAAQTGDLVEAARRKLSEKRVDLIVANDVSAPGSGFDVETNAVTFVSADAVDPTPLLTKREVAALLVDRIETLLAAQPAAPVSR
jgi:phosphopantothenoylcysteine decarboxylase/phosphopantothenate--cysteine ligase